MKRTAHLLRTSGLALGVGLALASTSALAAAPGNTPVEGETPAADGSRRLAVPREIVRALRAALPDRRRVRPALLSRTFDPNLMVSADTAVEVTFLWDGASFRNTFGYFTWQIGPDGVEILDRTLVFPNVSGRRVPVGQTTALRDAEGRPRIFPAGTRIGFFLIADGWDGEKVRGWDPASPGVPATDPEMNGAVGRGVYTTLDLLNPETRSRRPAAARHTAMLRLPGQPGFLDGRSFYVLGMEDADRSRRADEDFNDLVFVVRPTVDGALSGTHVLSAETGDEDRDHDGATGLHDYFPGDATRAAVRIHPGTDLRGRDGVTLAASTESVLDAAGATREIVATFHREAQAQAEVLLLAHLPADVRGDLFVERFTDTGEHVAPVTAPLSRWLKAEPDGRWSLRYPRLFLPGTGGEVRVSLRFDAPLPAWAPDRAFPWRLEGAPPRGMASKSGGRPVELAPTELRLLPQPWRLHAGD